ncbi:putative aromatic desulfoglucosinolate sulfotransferase [Helianthus annuus]|nr:putative aromatic desulfoglucosinolate sulfotransferase [Helianthus annuus]
MGCTTLIIQVEKTMSTTDQRDIEEVENIQQQHAQLLTELPRAVGSFGTDLHLYKGSWLPPPVLLAAMLMQTHFKHRSTDIFLSSFMKSGTTWLRSLMFTILNRSRFDFSDHPLLRKGPHECFPVVDLFQSTDYPISYTEDLSFPRLFASHFAHNVLPASITDPSSGCKFVYVCRDPKDVLISTWKFIHKMTPKELPQISLDQVFQMFHGGVIEYGPYWDHVLGFWKAALESPDKILFFKYEEIKRDPEAHVKKLAEFMGVPISVQEEDNGMVKKIVEFCSLEHLTSLEINKIGAQRFSSGHVVPNHAFFRRGEVGDWKSHLTKEMKDQIDGITHDKFKGSGLTIGATPK